MKLWIDDVRPAPDGYLWIKSVNEAKYTISKFEEEKEYYLDEWGLLDEGSLPPAGLWGVPIEVIDVDHDAGDYASDGGNYIKLLDWLEETGRNYPIRIHTANPVGRINMRAIIRKNNWREVE